LLFSKQLFDKENQMSSRESQARKLIKKYRKILDMYDLDLSLAESGWYLQNQYASEAQKRFFKQGLNFRWEVKIAKLKQKFGPEFVELMNNHNKSYDREKVKLGGRCSVKRFEKFIRARERRIVRRVATLIKKKRVKLPEGIA